MKIKNDDNIPVTNEIFKKNWNSFDDLKLNEHSEFEGV